MQLVVSWDVEVALAIDSQRPITSSSPAVNLIVLDGTPEPSLRQLDRLRQQRLGPDCSDHGSLYWETLAHGLRVPHHAADKLRIGTGGRSATRRLKPESRGRSWVSPAGGVCERLAIRHASEIAHYGPVVATGTGIPAPGRAANEVANVGSRPRGWRYICGCDREHEQRLGKARNNGNDGDQCRPRHGGRRAPDARDRASRLPVGRAAFQPSPPLRCSS